MQSETLLELDILLVEELPALGHLPCAKIADLKLCGVCHGPNIMPVASYRQGIGVACRDCGKVSTKNRPIPWLNWTARTSIYINKNAHLIERRDYFDDPCKCPTPALYAYDKTAILVKCYRCKKRYGFFNPVHFCGHRHEYADWQKKTIKTDGGYESSHYEGECSICGHEKISSERPTA